MAKRIILTHPKTGTVSRAKIRAAARQIAKSGKARSTKGPKGPMTKARTASGRGLIGFRKLSVKPAA